MKKLKDRMEFRPLLSLIIILLICGILSGGSFFKISVVEGHLYGRLLDILRNGSKYMILAIGMTMVLATGGTDISVGSVMAISGALACSIVDQRILMGLNGNVFAAIILALGAGALCGAWNGFLVAKLKVQPIVATLILMTAGRGIAQLIADGKIVTITSDAYYYISGGYILGLPFPMYIAAFMLILSLIMTKKTAFGLAVESIGVNSESARLAGIKVERNLWMIYVFCGVCAALAGLIESAGIKGADCNNCGLMIEMDGILAVAIGGTSLSGGRFSLISSIIGALVVQTITTMILAFGVAPEVIRVFKALIVIVVCLAQSPAFMAKMKGLFDKKRMVAQG
ncbi:MAG: ABC transporter permease [Lachnospiraceae bacterium]|nr:ABC transporter permease [Lachnospiraceae bacterium]